MSLEKKYSNINKIFLKYLIKKTIFCKLLETKIKMYDFVLIDSRKIHTN